MRGSSVHDKLASGLFTFLPYSAQPRTIYGLFWYMSSSLRGRTSRCEDVGGPSTDQVSTCTARLLGDAKEMKLEIAGTATAVLHVSLCITSLAFGGLIVAPDNRDKGDQSCIWSQLN